MKTSALSPTLTTLEPACGTAPQVKSGAAVAIAQPKTFKQGFWGAFGSTFLTIFLAEMGDKTQVATLLMSAQSQSPAIVFAGAAMALIATSLVGVLLGRWLATRISPKTLNSAAAVSLLFIAASLFWEIAQF